MSVAICDSGPLLAMANDRDPAHQAVTAFMRSTRHEIVVPALCIGEVAFLLARDFGAVGEAAFLDSCRHLQLIQPTEADFTRMASLVRQYSDFPLGAVDASVVALAEALDTPFVATLDHRHFRAIRPRHVESFTLLPEL